MQTVEIEVAGMSHSAPDWIINTRERDNGIDVISHGYHLVIQASYQAYQPHVLSVHIYKGVWPAKEGGFLISPPQTMFGEQYQFDINSNDQAGWSKRSTGKGFMTSQQLADTTLAKFLSIVKDARLKTNN